MPLWVHISYCSYAARDWNDLLLCLDMITSEYNRFTGIFACCHLKDCIQLINCFVLNCIITLETIGLLPNNDKTTLSHFPSLTPWYPHKKDWTVLPFSPNLQEIDTEWWLREKTDVIIYPNPYGCWKFCLLVPKQGWDGGSIFKRLLGTKMLMEKFRSAVLCSLGSIRVCFFPIKCCANEFLLKNPMDYNLKSNLYRKCLKGLRSSNITMKLWRSFESKEL
jgi:hypothetical protein